MRFPLLLLFKLGSKAEAEEQSECFSTAASLQQPEAKQGECRGRERGQQPVEDGSPHNRDTERRVESERWEKCGARDKEEREIDTAGKLKVRLWKGHASE